MTSYRPAEVVRFLGTSAIVVGGLSLVFNTANPSAHAGLYVICGLLVLGGLLLRIESAILCAGGVTDPPDESGRRPGHREDGEA